VEWREIAKDRDDPQRKRGWALRAELTIKGPGCQGGKPRKSADRKLFMGNASPRPKPLNAIQRELRGKGDKIKNKRRERRNEGKYAAKNQNLFLSGRRAGGGRAEKLIFCAECSDGTNQHEKERS